MMPHFVIAAIGALGGGYLGYLLGVWVAFRVADRERLPVVTFERAVPVQAKEGDYSGGAQIRSGK